MKKYVCMLLIAIVMLLAMGTSTFASADEEYTYLAILNHFWYGSDQSFAVGPVKASRTAFAELCFSTGPAVVILPEQTELDINFTFVAARLTFEKPFDVLVDDNGFEILQIPYDAVWEAKKVEIVGDVDYGMIAEIGDDYVILDSFDTYGGLTTRYTITPDTLRMWTNSPFEAGSGCQMIVDDEGVVLAMWEALG